MFEVLSPRDRLRVRRFFILLVLSLPEHEVCVDA
jgi:hypothetical protein